MWAFPILGVPYWGPYKKGILLFEVYIRSPLFFVNPHLFSALHWQNLSEAMVLSHVACIAALTWPGSLGKTAV